MNDQSFLPAENGKNRSARIGRFAKERLASEGVRMSLCLGVLICVYTFVLALLTVDTLENMFMSELYFSDDKTVSGLMQTAPFVVALIFTVPFFEGYRRMAGTVARGEEPDLRLIFSAFSSPKKFFDSYFIAFCAVFRIAVAIGIVAGSCALVSWLFHRFFDMSPGALVLLGTAIAASVVAAFWLYMTRFGGVRAYMITVRNASVGTAFKTSMQIQKKRGAGSGTLRLYVGYIPLILLSVLTLGVLFFIHTIPLISLAAAYNSEDLISGNQ